MDSHPARQVQLTPDEAKARLIIEAPAPLEVLIKDPAALVRAQAGGR